ncbi:MAG: hypothetical protein GWN18_17905, partial [Thermoplasmata archaeon]|nr:hypothetical protein [Thermoplasmata archaeon]NIS14000.1 hypothetical protein [Thermoplasmata archaeon]NIS21832.1 hypothetical protein [Thermoplasmata archaeon]NIT79437.1 hypothetical protein [Thermoplasmata archaeon]NIU50869.1 hypothetical protein [Thermoplasmata archaeon]
MPLDARRVTYRFVARDASGNRNSTTPASVQLVNLPPVISNVPIWEVEEETEESLDLGPHISDPNHPA